MKKGAVLFLLCALLFAAILLSLAVADVYELHLPANSTNTSASVINFTVNVTFTGQNGASWQNVSVWLSDDGILRRNTTNSTAVANGTLTNFSVSGFNEGTYNWTVSIGVDDADYFNESNYTIFVDLTPPNVSLLLPAAGNYTGSLIFNASVNDTFLDVVNVTYGYVRPGYADAWTTGTTEFFPWNTTLDTTTIDDGPWNISVNATDAAGNSNVTYNITEIIVDNSAPNASFVAPVNNTNLSIDILINATVNDTGTGVLYVSFGYQNRTSQITWVVANNSVEGFWNFTINSSDLVDGIYNLSINATDYVNNSLVAYNISFFTLDTIPPGEAPILVAANVSDSDNDGNIEINWTDVDDESAETYIVYRHSAEITEYNGSLANITVNRVEKGVQYFEDNTTTADNSTAYWYAVAAVDAAGNLNTSGGAINLSASRNSTANDSTMPNSPTNLNWSSISSSGSVTLHWLSVTTDVKGEPDARGLQYKVYRSDGNEVINTSNGTTITGTGAETLADTVSTNSSTFTVSENGTYIFIVTAIDDNSNENKSYDTSLAAPNLINVTVSITGSGSSGNGNTGSGSGGGSSGGDNKEDADAAVSQTKLWTEIKAGAASEFKITKSEIGIRGIKFTVTEDVANAEITVTKLASKPSTVTADYSGTVYQYLTVAKTNLKDTAVSGVTVEFRIARSWLTSNNALASGIVLLRYETDKWTELVSSETDLDASYIYYEASSPGLSTFAIALRPGFNSGSDDFVNTGSGDSPQGSGNETGIVDLPVVPKQKALLYTAVVIIIVALLAAGVGFFYYRKTKANISMDKEEEL